MSGEVAVKDENLAAEIVQAMIADPEWLVFQAYSKPPRSGRQSLRTYLVNIGKSQVVRMGGRNQQKNCAVCGAAVEDLLSFDHADCKF